METADHKNSVNIILKSKNEPPRSKLRGISRLVAALKTKQASGNITRRDLKKTLLPVAHVVKALTRTCFHR
jgi:hypothetical protein